MSAAPYPVKLMLHVKHYCYTQCYPINDNDLSRMTDSETNFHSLTLVN